MDRAERAAEDLLRHDQVPEERPAEAAPAGVAAARRVHRIGVLAELLVRHADPAERREERAGPGHARGDHAVEDVHPPVHRLEEVLGKADTHQVADVVHRQVRFGEVEHLLQQVEPLAHAHAADGHPVEGQILQRQGAVAAQSLEDAPLHDPEEELILALPRLQAPLGPAYRPLGGVPGVVARAGKGDALVEGHDDVSAQILLDLDRPLGGEELPRAVALVPEGDPLLGDVPVLHGEDLEPPGIGEHRSVPSGEPVQSAELLHQLLARAPGEVVGVGKDDLRPRLLHLLGRHGLQGALRSHGHERRGLHDPPREIEPASPRGGARCVLQKFVESFFHDGLHPTCAGSAAPPLRRVLPAWRESRPRPRGRRKGW